MDKDTITMTLSMARRHVDDFPTFNTQDERHKKLALNHIEQAIENVRGM